MWRYASRWPERRWSVLVFGLSAVSLYLASGLFHGLHYETPEQQRLFQRIDQSAIYFLIAGTYTPIFWCLLTGRWRRNLLWLMWGIAWIGIAALWLLPKAPHWFSVSTYLFMGWLGILPTPQLYRAVGWRAMMWAWYGAFFYTFGAICELTNWPMLVPGMIGPHEVLHLCDVAGTATHFVFIVGYVLPHRPRVQSPRKSDFPVAVEVVNRDKMHRPHLSLPLPGEAS